jgi:hypothetical protein
MALITNLTGYLDGGPRHMRPLTYGIDSNPDFIRFNILHAGNGHLIIQCVQTGHYLDGGPYHVRNKSDGIDHNPNFVRWKLVPWNGGHLIQCIENGHYLDSNPACHMWKGTPTAHPTRAAITWTILNKSESICCAGVELGV